MKSSKDKIIKSKIIAIGRKLAELGLVCCRSGNLSARLDAGNMLITATGAELGNLKNADIVKVDLKSGFSPGPGKHPSSELPMHRMIYLRFPCQTVIHCHPPLSNAYFAVMEKLNYVTFETHFYLNNVPVVRQKSINVTRPEAVIRALKKSGIVVLKNHGVFSIADNFKQALNPILILEEAVKVAALARLFKKDSLDKIDRQIKKCLLSRK